MSERELMDLAILTLDQNTNIETVSVPKER